MSQVVDYSFARPSPAAIKGAGFVGAMRYLSSGNANAPSAKDLSAGERDALLAAGLDIGLVWETSATRMNGGYGAGQADGRAANSQADGLGFPGDRPLYFANDQNACTDTHVDYMRGARDASRRPVGPYGNSALIDRCTNELGCRYGWKVSTWGPPTGNATLVQEANARPPIGGTDVNSVMRADWGQWHGSFTPPKKKKFGEEAFMHATAAMESVATPIPTPDPVPVPDPIPTPTPIPNPTPDPGPIPDPTPTPEPVPVPDPVPTPGGEEDTMVTIFNQGLYHAFTVGPDGTLYERYGNPPNGYNAIPGTEGKLRPGSSLSISRIVYDPDNAFYPAYFIGAEASDPKNPVIIIWAGDHWDVQGV